jgi:hypothetical protein
VETIPTCKPVTETINYIILSWGVHGNHFLVVLVPCLAALSLPPNQESASQLSGNSGICPQESRIISTPTTFTIHDADLADGRQGRRGRSCPADQRQETRMIPRIAQSKSVYSLSGYQLTTTPSHRLNSPPSSSRPISPLAV